MVHPALGRHGMIARKQTEAALIVVRCYIHDTLNEGDSKNCFKTLFRYLKSDEHVKLADIKIGLDPLDIIRAFVDDPRLDRRYREKQLRQTNAKIERKRRNRR
jgi:hypothetical protein